MKTTIVSLFMLITLCGRAQTQTVELFNGKDLAGWEMWTGPTNEQVFSVVDGIIHCTGQPMGFLYTKETYDNYQLHVEWRWGEKPSNSGIFIFMQNEHKHWCNAVEVQLCAGQAGDFVLLGGSSVAEFSVKKGEKRPDFPVIKGKSAKVENPTGEWNSADITVKGGTITVYINGIKQNYGSKSTHKSGHIGLQSEGGEVKFRNIRLTPLK